MYCCYVLVVVVIGKGRSAGEGGCRASLRDHSRLGVGFLGRGCWCGRFVKGGGRRGFVLGKPCFGGMAGSLPGPLSSFRVCGLLCVRDTVPTAPLAQSS
jgi:hypothetical protein